MSENRLNHFRTWGPVYWNTGSYRLTMKLLRPSGRQAMYRQIAQEIGRRSVVDLCCGLGELRTWLLGNPYQGVDKNPAFVAYLQKQNVSVVQGDILQVAWPASECLVMVESLYHFLPDPAPLLAKMKAQAYKKIIISESVVNVAHSPWRWVKWLSEWATRVDSQEFPGRFTEDSFRAALLPYGFQRFTRVNGTMVAVWNLE
jgi:SAM-dependent methyltransferase